MKYVLDSSVALKWVLPELLSSQAQTLRAEHRAGRLELLSPEVFSIEVAHALMKPERQGRIALTQGAIL